MKTRSIVSKLWLTNIGLVFLVLFFLMLSFVRYFQTQYRQDFEEKLALNNQLLSEVFNKYPLDQENLEMTFESNVEDFRSIIVVDENTIYTSDHNQINNQIAYNFFKYEPELNKVLTEQKKVTKEMFLPQAIGESGDDLGIIVGLPFDYKGANGAIYSFQTLEQTAKVTKDATQTIIVATIIGIGLATIVAFFFSSRFTRPLRQMEEMAAEIADGSYQSRIPIESLDEIGNLAKSFNYMAEQVDHHLTSLTQEKEQLSSILQSMNNGVMTVDIDEQIILTNDPAGVFLMYCQLDEEERKKSKTLSLPSVLRDLFHLTKKTGKTQKEDYIIQGHDWHVVMSPLYRDSEIRGVVAVLRETTEEKRLDKLRKDFLANVSHELRTPLAMLQGYSEAIIDDVSGSQEANRESAQIIYEESLRMSRLVNDLLDLTQMESAKISINKEPVELAPYLTRIVSKFQVMAEEKEIDLRLKMDNPDLVISVDPDRIEQVITNLIDNAFRHTPHHGTIEITQQTVKNGVNFHVKDSGSGISEADLPYVFERFYKVDKARTRGNTGTGLGLSIAKNIVENHSGVISLTSKLGEGTTFSFFIPKE